MRGYSVRTLLPLSNNGKQGLSLASIVAAVDAARKDGVCPRGLVFINPGNPTGQQLDAAELEGLMRVCHREELTLFADEVRAKGARSLRLCAALVCCARHGNTGAEKRKERER